MKNRQWIALIAAAATSAMAAPGPTEIELPAILKDRIEVSKRGTGIIVGVVDADGRRIYANGLTERGGRRVDADTLFEIGSITKVFTSILLAEMVGRGEVSLADPVSRYLPGDSPPLRFRDQEVTLLHLSRHTSGFPVMPAEFQFQLRDVSGAAAAYSAFSLDDLYAFTRRYQPVQTPGVGYTYSNVGVALLGQSLAVRAGKSYEDLLQERVLGPLGMKDTVAALSPRLGERKATGHDTRNSPVPAFDLKALLPTGGLKSTANDLLAFLEANLGLRKTTIDDALRATQKTDADTMRPDLALGLGWAYHDVAGERIVWHGGGTNGFTTFVGLDLQKRLGVVVLSNTEFRPGLVEIGLHTFNALVSIPRVDPPREFKMVAMQSSWADSLVGDYRVEASSLTLKLRMQDGALRVDISDGRKARLFAESETDYFTEDRQLAVHFEKDAEGKVTRARLAAEHWNGVMLPMR